MSLFYRQPGLFCPRAPPRTAIPESKPTNNEDPHRAQPPYMGKTFPEVCRFWRIMHEVSEVYNSEGHLPWGSSGTLSFAEFKFRELLAWSNNLGSRLSRGHNQPHHVHILQ